MSIEDVQVFVDDRGEFHGIRDDIPNKISEKIERIIDIDKEFEKRSNKTVLSFYTQQIVLIDNVYWNIHCFYLPKHWVVSEVCRDSFQDSDFVQDLVERLFIFYQGAKNLYKESTRIELLFQRYYNQDHSSLIHPQTELNLLRSMLNRIRKQKFLQREIISADHLIGQYDEELNKYNNLVNSQIQFIDIPKEDVYKIINSYIHMRYTPEYIDLLKRNKDKGLLPVFGKSLRVLKQLKRYTKYKNQKQFVSKKLLHSESQYIKKIDRTLYSLLEKMLKLNGFRKRNVTLRHFVNISKVWEWYLNKYKFQIPIDSDKQKRDFIEQKNLSFTSEKYKTSEPDYVDEAIVYDAKYKYLSTRSVQQVLDSDLNKLIRDMVVFEKKIGALVYPQPMRVSDIQVSDRVSDIKHVSFCNTMKGYKLELHWFPFIF